MSRIGLWLARFMLSGWCGAAALYVVTSVREQVSPKFSIAIKDELALIRFPAYYLFGFTMVGLSLLGLLISSRRAAPPAHRWSTVLVVAALVVMLADYQLIYLPLVELLNPVGQERAGEFLDAFTRFHTASKYINMASVSLCVVASFLLAGPIREERINANPI